MMNFNRSIIRFKNIICKLKISYVNLQEDGKIFDEGLVYGTIGITKTTDNDKKVHLITMILKCNLGLVIQKGILRRKYI